MGQIKLCIVRKGCIGNKATHFTSMMSSNIKNTDDDYRKTKEIEIHVDWMDPKLVGSHEMVRPLV